MIKVFLLVSAALIAIWFRGLTYLGGGETNIPFYNLGRVFDSIKSPWIDINLGVYITQGVVNIPFFGTLSFIQNLGISGVLIQAGFFFCLVFLTLLSMYLLCKEFFPNSSFLSWGASAFFYLFNLYSLMNIWNRFLLNMMLFYAVLPLGVLIFIKGLKQKKYGWAILLGIYSIIFSYAFSSPAHIVIFWGLIFYTTIFYFLFIEKKFFVIKFFSLTFFIWFIFNFWWISQQIYFSYSQAFAVISQNFFTSIGNLDALNSLSDVLGKTSNLFLLKHGTFFSQTSDYPYNWPLVYNSFFALTFEWLILIVTLSVVIRKIKKVEIKYFFTLFIIGIFLAKGNNFPLGEIFNLAFQKVAFIQFFRNPFEKLGIILPLAFAPLFGMAFWQIFNYAGKFKKKMGCLVFGVAFFYLFIFSAFPYWSGLIFTSSSPQANKAFIGIQVVVPNYYKQANDWLKSDRSVFRFLTFPLGGEGIVYNWQKGYNGVELSPLLFEKPTISNVIDFPYYKEIAASLEKTLIKHQDFYRAAQFLNAKYFLLRPDINFQASQMRDPKYIENILDQRVASESAKLKLSNQFGPLKFYQFNDDAFLPKIYPAKNLIFTNQLGNLEDVFLGGGQMQDALMNIGNLSDPNIKNREIANIVHNQAIYEIPGPQFPLYTEAPYIFPYVNRTPSSSLYSFILFREKIEETTFVRDEDRIRYQITTLGKRLRESELAFDQGDMTASIKALRLYDQKLPIVLANLQALFQTSKVVEDRFRKESNLFGTFSSHVFLLNDLEIKSHGNRDIVNLKNEIKQHLAEYKILPYFSILSNPQFPIKDRIVYQFTTAQSGEYEIRIPTNSFYPDDFTPNDEIYMQIDDQIVKRKLDKKNDYVSFGTITGDRGVHEISFNQLSETNLVNAPSEITLETENSLKKIEFPIANFDAFTQYDLSLDYFNQYGDGFVAATSLNTDLPSVKEDILTYFDFDKLTAGDYYYDFRHYSTIINPATYSNQADLVLQVKPWNNCTFIFLKTPKKCDNYSFRVPYNRPTRVIIKNLKLVPRLPREMSLIDESSRKAVATPQITFTRFDSTKYQVKVKAANEPFILVLSELFDPNWRVYYQNKEISGKNHYLINGYANAWFIDKTGDFELTLEFWPNRLLIIGLAISTVTVTCGLLYLLYKYKVRKEKYEI